MLVKNSVSSRAPDPAGMMRWCSIADDARPFGGQSAYLAGKGCIVNVSQEHRSFSTGKVVSGELLAAHA